MVTKPNGSLKISPYGMEPAYNVIKEVSNTFSAITWLAMIRTKLPYTVVGIIDCLNLTKLISNI